jgi:hypothetical protein
MKKLATALLALALVAPAAEAQTSAFDSDVAIQFTNNITNRRTGATGFGGEGGGYSTNFAVDFPTVTLSFNDYLMWCIDADRGVNVPSTKTYVMYTVENFANNSFGSVGGYDVNLSDMRRITSLVNELETNWAGYTVGERNDIQGSIWQTFRGQATYPNSATLILPGNANFNVTDWYVMWNGESQTFLVRVAEPGTLAVVLLGMSMLAFVIIRRRTA